MKNNWIFIVLLFISYSISSQETPKEESYQITLNEGEKLVRVLSSQQIYVNSATKIGGKTRVYFPIEIPQNTLRWFYVVTTTKGEKEGEALNVLGQLAATTLTGGASTIARGMTTTVTIPSGSGGVVDSYLLDRQNLDVFTSKGDNWGQSLYYNIEGTRENFRSGLIMINNPSFQYVYIGIKNPSSSLGVNVKIEAIAITRENADWYKSSPSVESLKEFMEKTFNGHFKYKYSQQVSDELTVCSLSKIMREKRADELISLFKYEESYKNYFDEIVKSCEDEYRKKHQSANREKSNIYNNFGWEYYLKNDLPKAYENYLRAIEIDPNNGVAIANLGLLLILDNKTSEAKEKYVEAITCFKKDMIDGKNNMKEANKKIVELLNFASNREIFIERNQLNDINAIEEIIFQELNKMN